MHEYGSNYGEAHQSQKRVVDLQKVIEALHSLVVLKGFENFEEPSDTEKPVESWESNEAEQRVVVVALVGLTVKFVFDQVGGDACQEIDDHSRLRVVQHHFLLRSLQLFVIFEVRAEQVDQDVNEEQEVNQKIENKSKEALCVSKGNLIRHDSGSVYQQENQNYIPNLLKHTVGMNQLSWQLLLSSSLLRLLLFYLADYYFHHTDLIPNST